MVEKTDTPVSPEGKETSPKPEATKAEKTDTPENKPAGEPTTPEQKVVVLEAEVERLKGEAERKTAIAKTAQKKERIERIERKKLDRELKRIKS